MIRDLMSLPGVPRTLLDDIGELKELDRLDERIARVERDMTAMRGDVDGIADAVPTIGKGPLEKAKDALTGT